MPLPLVSTMATTTEGNLAAPILVDPTTKSDRTHPAFPLTTNDLEQIMQLEPAFAGQWSIVSSMNQSSGSHLCYITTQTPCPVSTWSSVQTSKQSHIELNSALVYMNHSCAPTVEIEVFSPDENGLYVNGRAGEVRVVKGRDLQKGEELTFFYPSTEYISPRPFKCLCTAGKGICIGVQEGACSLDVQVLARHFINKHIYQLLGERDSMKF